MGLAHCIANRERKCFFGRASTLGRRSEKANRLDAFLHRLGFDYRKGQWATTQSLKATSCSPLSRPPWSVYLFSSFVSPGILLVNSSDYPRRTRNEARGGSDCVFYCNFY